jgi:hypothetical protein
MRSLSVGVFIIISILISPLYGQKTLSKEAALAIALEKNFGIQVSKNNMEIIKNRYGDERVIEKINATSLRVMGESLIVRSSQDEDGNQTMFDFEGGPCLNVGGKIKFMKTEWTITSVSPEDIKHEGLVSVRIGIKL